MLIDNSQLIRPKLDFSDPDKFYLVTCTSKDLYMKRDFIISSLEDFDGLTTRFEDFNNVGFYIDLNRKSYRGITCQIIQDCTKMLNNSDYSNFEYLCTSALYDCRSSDRHMLISIPRTVDLNEIYEIIENSEPLNVTDKVEWTNFTGCGFDIITKPFDSYALETRFNTCVLTNCITTLYYNYE